MTREKVAFIGRESEIEQVETLIDTRGQRRVLFIQGEGGVGKTRLLQEIRERCLKGREAPVQVTEVLTFDDRNLRLPENLRYRLAEELGLETFEPYCRCLVDLQKAVEPGLSRKQLEQKVMFKKRAVNILKKRKVWLLLISLLEILKD